MVENIKYDPDTKDFDSLINENKSKYYQDLILGIFIVVIVSIQLIPIFSSDIYINDKISNYLTAVNNIDKNVSIDETYKEFFGWLDKFGTKGERIFFSMVSLLVIKVFLIIYDAFPKSTILISLLMILANSVLQLTFVILACWKVWIGFVVYAFFNSMHSIKPYISRDILGVTGNGRLFFSGVKAGIKKCDKNGNPTLHVTGLTCLSYVNDNIYNKSAFCSLLEKFDANNTTNKYLASIILNYYNYPTVINDNVGTGNLFEDTYEFLLAAFEIREAIINNGEYVELSLNDKRKENMFLCLTDNMKKELKNISPKNIATAILALETGRILAYDHISNDRWARQSNYPHLCARAVLHSSPYYHPSVRQVNRKKILLHLCQPCFSPVKTKRRHPPPRFVI